jgi:4-carboxymuconolactone decarboxylase
VIEGEFDLNGRESPMSHLTPQQRELVAIGASLASNCIPCIQFHVRQARETGLTDEVIRDAVEVADAVRQVPARKVRESASAALGRDSGDAPKSKGTAGAPCCSPGGADERA